MSLVPAPTPADLVVLCLPGQTGWQKACSRLLESGFREVTAFNPYRQQRGRTLKDHDHCCHVLEQATWTRAEQSRAANTTDAEHCSDHKDRPNPSIERIRATRV